jgi:hypothetical protein
MTRARHPTRYSAQAARRTLIIPRPPLALVGTAQATNVPSRIYRKPAPILVLKAAQVESPQKTPRKTRGTTTHASYHGEKNWFPRAKTIEQDDTLRASHVGTWAWRKRPQFPLRNGAVFLFSVLFQQLLVVGIVPNGIETTVFLQVLDISIADLECFSQILDR